MSLSESDSRIDLLRTWLCNELKLDIQALNPASSDASFRRYFRVIQNNRTQIVMDAPPDKENIEAFMRIATLLAEAGLHVPHIEHFNLEQGFLLLEDFGSTHYLQKLNDGSATTLYADALDSLWLLQTRTDPASSRLPCYDQALLQRELGIFYEWFLDRRLGLQLPAKIQSDLEHLLIRSALEQPQLCVHRDFHSRNLMYLPNRNPGIIDFQDAVVGPITYDLVSLLRDCYIRWPETLVNSWLHEYFLRLRNAGLVTVDFENFLRWFDLMGLQRHLKAIGIFSRLDLRDGKPAYLADIPRVFAHVQHVCGQYAELSSLADFIAKHISAQYLAIS